MPRPNGRHSSRRNLYRAQFEQGWGGRAPHGNRRVCREI